MRVRSCRTTAPAPRFRWPTSELPICPSGSPTARPQAVSCVCGCSAQSPSNTGVSASATALPGPGGARPQPSRMTRQTRWTGGGATNGLVTARAAATICAKSSGSRLAPPTSAPSMSGWARISAALSGFTLPPYRMRTRSAASFERSPDERADERDRLLRLLGRRDLPGADRPDRLVGDHDVGELVVGHLARAPPGPGGAACAASRRARAPPPSRRRRGSAGGRPRARPGPSPAARGRSRRSTGAARSGRAPRRARAARVSIGAETSPVNAPASSWCMFCADTITSLPSVAATTAAAAR